MRFKVAVRLARCEGTLMVLAALIIIGLERASAGRRSSMSEVTGGPLLAGATASVSQQHGAVRRS
eukprot:632981-Rhodomonas_salina.3